MQTHTSALLTSLLTQAQVHTVVAPFTKSLPSITVSQYRATYLSSSGRYDPNRSPLALYKVELIAGPTRASLRRILVEALQEFTLNDRVQVPLTLVGYSVGAGFPLDDFVDKLVELSVLFSPRDAAQIFITSLSDLRCKFQEFALLGSLSIAEPIQVFDGVRLVPLSKSSSELPPWLPPIGISEVPITAFLGRTVLAMDRYVSPRYQVPSLESREPGQKVFTTASGDAPHFDANTFCLCLALACKTSVQPSLWWQHVHQSEIAALHGGGGRLTAYSDRRQPGAKTISQQDVHEAKLIYEAFEGLDAVARQGLDIPLTRWIGSLGSKSPVDQAIDLGIALEALYAADGGEEISFRLRIRAAKHLREDVDDQNAVSEQIKKVYRLRSQAVHEGQFSKKKLKVGGNAIEHGELLQIGQELCRQGILRVVEDGRLPDWRDMGLA